MNKLTSQIPNLLTLCNLLFGMAAIFIAFLPGASLIYAALCILVAALFDLLDGLAARALKATSSIGGDLDSLSDLVSFGVAPVFLLFSALDVTHWSGSSTYYLWLLPLALPALAGSYRLARYNNITEHEQDFRGMPIPANALFWVGIALGISTALNEMGILVATLLLSCEAATYLYALLLTLVGFSLLTTYFMLSRLRFLSLKFSAHESRNRMKARLVTWIILLIVGVVAFILWGWIALSLFILVYALASFIFFTIYK